MSRRHLHKPPDDSPEQPFEIDALVIVRAVAADSACDNAGELVRPAETIDGRVHLALLASCERSGS